MNAKTEFKNFAAIQSSVLWPCLAALALVLTVPARAETRPAAIPFSGIGARATADYQGDALGIRATVGGAQLRCGFQKLEGHATAEGLWLESTGPGATGKLRLVATALCREGSPTRRAGDCAPYQTRLPATGTVSVEDKVVRFTRPGLMEEYSVSVDGVRQDFVIAAPPAGAGDLRVELALSGARAEASVGGARLRLDGSGRALAYSRLRVEDATGRELTARLEVLSGDRLSVSVADANATYPVRIDPTFSDADWVSLNPGIPGANGPVNAMAVDGSGNVYVGGSFTLIGTVPANNIAKWNGSAWSALGSGINGYVYALAVSGTDLYVGGSFTMAGGMVATNIAEWDGSAWTDLASGMGGNSYDPFNLGVSALALSGTNLYAGGWFTTAGGVPANYIAKWDGSAWSALGSGMGGSYPSVYALAVSGTDLYAGGYFTTAGGVTANNIAKWDGNAWSALGSGMNGGVIALAVSGPNLYAGGEFTTAGGVPATNIAKWDGNAWSALGAGLNGGRAYALVVSGTNLYAGGYLTMAGGVPANYIATWNGSAWSALGSGMSFGNSSWAPRVVALAADGAGHLFVGGDFLLAGTNLSPYIAQANVGSAPTNPPPVVFASPASLLVAVGATAEFQVEATGTPPLVYQWVFNGTTAIAGATSALLSLTNVQLTEAGTYSVIVRNLYGAATSAPALLQVFPPGMVVTNSEANLREAMALGGTITFACNGTITLANRIVIGANTVLDGRGQQVTISGRNLVRVFDINNSVTLTMVNLTIANGLGTDGYGGGIYNQGTLNATNCHFVANTVQGPPGVTYPDPGQDGCGGAVYNLGALNIVDCSFVSNSACGGTGSTGSGAIDYSAGAGGTARGGAICNLGGMAIERSLFASNATVGGVGGTGANGGFFYYPVPPIPAGSGGAGGDACGGALFVGGPSSLINCTLAGNEAGGGTGGAGGGGSVYIVLNTNTWTPQPVFGPGGYGGSGGTACGAVYDATGALRLTNCTIAFNSSVGGSGGVGGSGNPNGSAGGSGVSAGALQTANGVLVNCLLDRNSPTNSTGSILDAGHNLSSDASCGFTHPGSMNNTDPMLGPLANNGGPTLTMALLPGSPAIDAGNTSLAPATDQRGFPRPAGSAADIGAYEYGSVMPTIAISRSGATGLNIVGSGNAGRPCRLLSSTDLSNWVPMATNSIGSDGTILFSNNCASGGACRFYLLVMP